VKTTGKIGNFFHMFLDAPKMDISSYIFLISGVKVSIDLPSATILSTDLPKVLPKRKKVNS
ncbi:hypothetical protein, partial [Klebsiella pneumoniae]|uniref:hypothetical protein n=1 Tax=Klebsiella pneumoniae TaxID=573 RepID=UPI001BE0AD2A